MDPNENRLYYEENRVSEQQVAVYLAKVMGWMCLGLFTTLVSALCCLASNTLRIMVLSNYTVVYGVMVAQIVVVMGLSFAINKLSPAAATALFMFYAALTGVTMSVIARFFELSSVIFVFALTAFIFVTMSVYGFVTRKDLTKIGTLAIFGLFGIVIGGIVNIFLRNTMMDLIITCVGILVFIVLIAYDTQKIKGIYLTATAQGFDEESPQVRKLAVIGALTLYLDFINLFLKLLRIFGKRRS